MRFLTVASLPTGAAALLSSKKHRSSRKVQAASESDSPPWAVLESGNWEEFKKYLKSVSLAGKNFNLTRTLEVRYKFTEKTLDMIK